MKLKFDLKNQNVEKIITLKPKFWQSKSNVHLKIQKFCPHKNENFEKNVTVQWIAVDQL